MAKSADAFRTISEVAEWLETPAHVLRFWESKFRQLKPVKRAGGRRYYRPSDMMLLGGIKKLLHTDGMTIKGVQKLLREQGVKHVASHSQPLDDITAAEVEDTSAGSVSDTISPPAETVMDFKRGELEATPSHPVDFDAEATDSAGEAASEGSPEPADQDTSEDTQRIDDDVSEDETVDDEGDAPETGAAAEEETRDTDSDISEQETPNDSADIPPVMPSFMHRSPEPDAESDPEPEPEPEPETDSQDVAQDDARPARKPNVIDLPADPDDDTPADPGILSHIMTLNPPISDDMADRLGLVLERLRQSGRKNEPGQDG